MADDCLPQVHAFRMRVAVLGADGVPLPGAENLYTTNALTTLTLGTEVADATEIEERNGGDDICVAYQGDPLEIGFNYSYLQDILKNLAAESVVLSLKDSQSAALLKPVQETGEEMGVLCLLMPLRLAGD